MTGHRRDVLMSYHEAAVQGFVLRRGKLNLSRLPARDRAANTIRDWT